MLKVTARHQRRLRQYVSDSQALLLMWLVIEDHDNLFIMAEFVHFAGIGMLLYKLFSKKNAGGMDSSHLCSNCNSQMQHGQTPKQNSCRFVT